MVRRDRVECGGLAAAALLGVGVAHLAEYLFFLGGDGARHPVLGFTGREDHLGAAATVGAMLLVVAVTAAVVPAIRRGVAGKARGRTLPSPAASAGAQALIFTAVEVGERVLTEGHLPHLLPVLLVGLPLQLLIGWSTGRVFLALARAAERVGYRIAVARFRSPARVPTLRPSSRAAPSWFLPFLLDPTRGPPLSSLRRT